MATSVSELKIPAAVGLLIDDDTLTVELADGRAIRAPLIWYPRLLHASAAERSNWRLIGGGEGVHWPDVEEDISIASIVAGNPSAERPESLKKWLAGRERR